MLDQNLTTLLAALLGGFLSIIGGISANFYIQQATANAERQKEARSMVETIYKDTQKILGNCYKLDSDGWDGYSVKTSYEELVKDLDEIEMLIDLHFSKMKNIFDEYRESITDELAISIKQDKISPEYTMEHFPDTDKQEEGTKKFRDAIRSILHNT